MKIFLQPQVDENRINYNFKKETVEITIENITEEFDFSDLPDGKLVLRDEETDKIKIETSLKPFPIISAEKKDGVLYIELLNWISEDASESERFPEWIDANNYEPPAKPEPSPEPGEESESEENPLENWGEF